MKKYVATAEDRVLIFNPEKWPRWPFMPVKRMSDSGRPDCGFILANGEATVYEGNIFYVGGFKTVQEICNLWPKKIAYPDFEALFNAGWVVE